VELMYLNHREEESLLEKPEIRQASAEAICEGLRQYVEGTGTIEERGEMGR
jgi:N-acetylmuramoyl-L-alanine amidase